MKHLLFVAGLAACDSGTRPTKHEQPPTGAAATAIAAAPADADTVDVLQVEPLPEARVEPSAPPIDPFDKLFGLAPLATRDGKLVMVPVKDDDGARGLPNLTLELRDRSDTVVQRVVVLAVEEDLDAAKRAERAAAAERLLTNYKLEPLMPLGNDIDHFGGGTKIAWQRGRYTISYDDKPLVTRAVPAKWRSASYYNRHEGITCKNPDLLGNAWFDVNARVAVVEIAYEGTDSCWAPSRQRHVVGW